MIRFRSSARARRWSRLTALAGIGLALVLPPTALHAQTPRACQPNDSTASALRDLGVWILTDTSATVASFRSGHGIPAGSANDVVRVTDASVCEAATAAVEAKGAPPQSEAFVVVRLGSVNPFYLVARKSETLIAVSFLMDRQFHIVTTFTSPG